MGCQVQSHDYSTYIGGEIINPKSNFVLLMQRGKLIDSLFLNEHNIFGKKIYGLQAGLYSFKHGYEFQHLYLDPKDSIKLRLNTWDFDETIVFEGKGALKNEFLINMFLENEKEAKNFFSYFSLPENEFQKKIDAVYKRHTKQLQDLLTSEKDLSNEYIYIAKATIIYPLYRLKELYPYYHKKALQSDSLIHVSSYFYRFREIINLNDPILSDYHAYRSYVTTYLYNLAYHKNNGVLNDKKFFPILLNLISEKIKDKTVKNNLLQKEIDHIFINKPQLLTAEVLKIFYKNSTDSIAIASLKELLTKKESLKKKNSIPNFEIATPTGEIQDIHTVLNNKDTVLYFWSSDKFSNDYLNKRISFLINKHPDVTFIGINTGVPKTNSSSCLKLENQYYLTATSLGKDLVSNKFPRAILINSKGQITNSFSVLTSNHIDAQIDKFQNH